MRAATDLNVDGLVNCTPIGHKDSPGNPLPANCFGGQSWAFDAVYVPIDTQFLTCAKQAGLDILSGFDLFLYQAVDSFIYFTDQSVDFDEVTAGFVEHEKIHSDLVSF
jgi:shikimate dehydrogenase